MERRGVWTVWSLVPVRIFDKNTYPIRIPVS